MAQIAGGNARFDVGEVSRDAQEGFVHDTGRSQLPFFLSPALPAPLMAVTNTLPADGTVYYGRFVVTKAITVNKLALHISDAGGGAATVEMGIYSSTPQRGPTALLGTTGAVSVATTVTGVVTKDLTASLTLTAGVYFTAVLSQDWKSAKLGSAAWASINSIKTALYDQTTYAALYSSGPGVTTLPATDSAGGASDSAIVVPLVWVLPSNLSSNYS